MNSFKRWIRPETGLGQLLSLPWFIHPRNAADMRVSSIDHACESHRLG
jgi:hypothetical protein